MRDTWLLALTFWLLETGYFGWNLGPSSNAEIICDGIVLLIYAAGRHP